MIKELSIHGLRGFGKKQAIHFSIPDGEHEGSGLSFIVGANNAGKTTIIEAVRAFNTYAANTPTFSEGRRNTASGRRVYLTLKDENDVTYTIATVAEGGSSTQKTPPTAALNNYVLQSRRFVPYEFGKGSSERSSYIQSYQTLESNRSSSLNSFNQRIFLIQKNKLRFDAYLEKILGYQLKWTIEQRDSGSFYIQYENRGDVHSSEGIGDGMWSIFTICDALYDAKEHTSILIDEPELSLHPSLQRRLMEVLVEESRDKQIILSTHSPYFVNWDAIANGAALIRVVKEETNSVCYQISSECAKKFDGILRDLNNPHTLGTDATEALFLEDRIILVEGQEDVVIFRRLSRQLDLPICGSFFGWGVGGAGKMGAMLHLFRDLGYKNVVAVFDGDKAKEAAAAAQNYSEYTILVLPKDDIRDKPSCTRKDGCAQFPCYRPAKEGLTTESGQLKEGTEESVRAFLAEINTALLNRTASQS